MTNDKTEQAADHIIAAWDDPALRVPTASCGPQPRNLADAYQIQATVSGRFGAIGGWRICQPGGPLGRACAPLPLASIRPAPAQLDAAYGVAARLQPELCFRLQHDLPDYDAPYARDQVRAAIRSAHPAVVVLHPGSANHCALDPLGAIANACDHRYLIYGPAIPAWPDIDAAQVAVSVLQDGRRAQLRSNPSGASGLVRWLEGQGLLWARAANPPVPQATGGNDDPLGLVQWLANEGARWAGGLLAGQWIAVSLGIEEISVPADAPARVVLGGLGAITLQFS